MASTFPVLPGCRRRGVLCALLVSAFGLVDSSIARELPALHEKVVQGEEYDWVEPAELRLDAAEPPESDREPLQYALIDAQVRLPREGTPTTYLRSVYRVNSRSALESGSSWEIEFEPSYQRVVIHHLKVYRDGRWSDRMGRSRWSVLQRETDLTRHMFDQRLSVLALLEDVRVGDVVSVAYSLCGSNPVFGDRYAGSFGMGWSTPVERRRLRFVAHRSHDVRFKVHGADLKPVRRRNGEWSETVWDVVGVPAYESENDAPHDWVAFPWVQVSEYADWSEVVEWALPLYREANERPRALRGLARKLTASAESPRERVVAARNWVQDEIRYLAILLGEHSHAPHGAGEVLNRRYGDCKDKAVLLVALLRSFGIEAWPALVNTGARASVRNWLPGPTSFDHVVVAAGRGQNRVWIDPTLRFQGGSRSGLYVPPYGAALLIRPGEADLTSIPAAHADPGGTRVFYRYRLKDDQSAAQVEIFTEYDGQQAEMMRGTLAGTTEDGLLEQYVDYYSGPGKTVTAKRALEVQDDRAKNHVTVAEHYEMRHRRDPDTGIQFEILPLLIQGDLQVPQTRDRTAPLALPYPLRRVEVVVLNGPPGLDMEPVNEKQENRWFRFSATSRRLDRGLEITYRLETLVDRVAPGDLASYTEAVTRMQNALGYGFRDADDDALLRAFALAALLVCLFAIFLAAVAVVLAWRLL